MTTAPMTRARALWVAIRQQVTLHEILVLSGGAAVIYGAALIARPAGWIVGGILALAFGLAPLLRDD